MIIIWITLISKINRITLIIITKSIVIERINNSKFNKTIKTKIILIKITKIIKMLTKQTT